MAAQRQGPWLLLSHGLRWLLQHCQDVFFQEGGKRKWKACPYSSLFSSVHLLSCVWLLMTPWTAACQAFLSSPAPGACSNSCPSSWWCHPTISSSIVPFSFCLQSFPASGSFPMSQLFALGGQSIGASASASVLPVNIQDWFPLGLTALILKSKGLSRIFSWV